MPRKKRARKKKKEHEILVVAEEFRHRKDKKVAGGALAVLLKRLGIPGGTEGLKTLGADLVASKSGFTALLLVGYTAAIGTGWLVSLSDSGSRPKAGSSVFDNIRAQDAALAAAASGGALDAFPRDGIADDGMSPSLGYFNEANRGALGVPGSGEEGLPGSDEPGDAPEVDSGVGVPDNNWGTAGAGAAAAVAAGRKLKRQKGISSKSDGSTKASVAAPARRSASASNKGKSAALRKSGGSRGPARKALAVRRNSNKAASRQALEVRKTLRNSLGRGNLSSARAGRPYDGGRGKVNRIGETSDASASGGPGTGGTSRSCGARGGRNADETLYPPISTSHYFCVYFYGIFHRQLCRVPPL